MKKRIAVITVCLLIVMTLSSIGAVGTSMRTVEAPRNLTARLDQYEDGSPHFVLSFILPDSVKRLVKEAVEDEGLSIFYEVEMKVGNGEWLSTGSVGSDVGIPFTINPEYLLDVDNVSVAANTYQFRVKIGVYTAEADEDGYMIAKDPVYSSYSNIATIGVTEYKQASSWAIPELDKAAQYGFITDRIKDKMDGPISREELCEVIMKLYEKMVGQATYKNMNAFTDTVNPEIFKAYELGIVNGVGNKRFAPNDLTNREQVASMLFRAVKAVKPSADMSITGAESFGDEKEISSWALESVKFMSKNGFMRGSSGRIDPKGTTTREQAVLMIVRVYEKYLD